jgi:hypothetical protein
MAIEKVRGNAARRGPPADVRSGGASRKELAYSKQVPVRHEVDVLIAGGGPAGVAAAVSAARAGLKTFLVEAEGAFGGMGTLGMVPTFLGFGDGVRTLAGGIGVEVVRRLAQAGGTPHPDLDWANLSAIVIDHETLKRVYDDMVTEAGVKFLFFTRLIDVIREGNRVHSAIFSAKSGLFAVQARLFVDATGDGDLCALAGAEFAKGDASGTLMPGTLCAQWADIDWASTPESRGYEIEQLKTAIADKVFAVPDPHLCAIERTGPDWGVGNLGHLFGIDNTDEESVSRHMMSGRKMLIEYQRFYREYLSGYKRMNLRASASLPGIRETRRILGDYVLTVDDFVRRASFPDEIGRMAYPVDIHPSKTDAKTQARFAKEIGETYHYAPGESYGIPYRSLLPRSLENVYVTGRCISADRHVFGSIRVQPGAFITGMAAGVAASLALEHEASTRRVDAGSLRDVLRRHGAYLP